MFWLLEASRHRHQSRDTPFPRELGCRRHHNNLPWQLRRSCSSRRKPGRQLHRTLGASKLPRRCKGKETVPRPFQPAHNPTNEQRRASGMTSWMTPTGYTKNRARRHRQESRAFHAHLESLGINYPERPDNSPAATFYLKTRAQRATFIFVHAPKKRRGEGTSGFKLFNFKQQQIMCLQYIEHSPADRRRHDKDADSLHWRLSSRDAPLRRFCRQTRDDTFNVLSYSNPLYFSFNQPLSTSALIRAVNV